MRLLPLDAPGRVEVRPGRVAGSRPRWWTSCESSASSSMVSVWPTVNPTSDNYAEMDRRGLLVAQHGGPAGCTSRSGTRAPTARPSCASTTRPTPRPAATSGTRSRTATASYGIRAFWLDACEPEILADNAENARYYIGPGLEVQGVYPRGACPRLLRGAAGRAAKTRSLLLCRSAWAGSQRYGAAVWSGDIESTFEALAAQIPAGLNIGIVRDPVVDDRHRRVQERRPDLAVLPRARRALVPVRRVLPALQAPRRPRAGHPRRLGADRRGQRGVVVRRGGVRA